MADVTRRVDDLDKTSEAAERISFSVRGQDFEIDLTEEHIREFDEALERFLKAARKAEPQPIIAPGRGRRRTRGGGSGSRDDIGLIREWARAQGLQVNDRGRMKK